MRAPIALLALLLAGAGGDPGQPPLSAKDVRYYFAPYVPQVKACYAAAAPGHDTDGHLRLELVIEADGHVGRVGVVATGINGGALGRLATCLRDASDSWRFPVRRGGTTAELPLLLQRTLTV